MKVYSPCNLYHNSLVAELKPSVFISSTEGKCERKRRKMSTEQNTLKAEVAVIKSDVKQLKTEMKSMQSYVGALMHKNPFLYQTFPSEIDIDQPAHMATPNTDSKPVPPAIPHHPSTPPPTLSVPVETPDTLYTEPVLNTSTNQMREKLVQIFGSEFSDSKTVTSLSELVEVLLPECRDQIDLVNEDVGRLVEAIYQQVDLIELSVLSPRGLTAPLVFSAKSLGEAVQQLLVSRLQASTDPVETLLLQLTLTPEGEKHNFLCKPNGLAILFLAAISDVNIPMSILFDCKANIVYASGSSSMIHIRKIENHSCHIGRVIHYANNVLGLLKTCLQLLRPNIYKIDAACTVFLPYQERASFIIPAVEANDFCFVVKYL